MHIVVCKLPFHHANTFLSGPVNFSPDVKTVLGTIWFDRNTGLMVFIKFSLNDQVGEGR